jgi:hypothetical protein
MTEIPSELVRAVGTGVNLDGYVDRVLLLLGGVHAAGGVSVRGTNCEMTGCGGLQASATSLMVNKPFGSSRLGRRKGTTTSASGSMVEPYRWCGGEVIGRGHGDAACSTPGSRRDHLGG